MISNPSNISSPSSPLVYDQPLFIPISCSCNSINETTSISYAGLNYTIKKGDTFYIISTYNFQNLTTYQSVEVVNPSLVPTNLEIGVNVIFPIFCKCPGTNQSNFLISYVLQPSDTFASIASRFGSNVESMIEVNGDRVQPFETVFVPVSKLPKLNQPIVSNSSSNRDNEDKGTVVGLGIGLGICGGLLILVSGLFGYREYMWRKKSGKGSDVVVAKGGKGFDKGMKMNFVADASECLDRYKVYEVEELRRATEGFDEKYLIEGSVYKGFIDDELYAIKKMKWNACEELKILQKVNHGNLVKLVGFCIDPEDASCYLVYEYIENGSLHSWLHGNKNEMLNWKTRLRIAIDVANGLQYVHEHTRPRVVHKDINSGNILLDSNLRGKIANFGLARSGCNAITMHIVGTQGYIAPEYIADGIVSTKMDVFSFGVVLLELVSGKEAMDREGRVLWMSVDGILDGSEERRVRRVRNWMDEVLSRESCPMESIMNVVGIAIACLNGDPSKRPSMVDIVYALCKSDELFFDISDESRSPLQVLGR